MSNKVRSSTIPGERASVAVTVENGHTVHADVVASISDSDPADIWIPCIPNDDAVLVPPPVGLFVGTAGNVSLMDGAGNVALFKNVPNCTILPFQPSRVRSSGTSAADIVLIYRSDP